jgi:hypothetical protein
MLKSKTMWFALTLSILGAVEASLNLFSDILTPTTYGVITMGVGVVVAILRILTISPLSEK